MRHEKEDVSGSFEKRTPGPKMFVCSTSVHAYDETEFSVQL